VYTLAVKEKIRAGFDMSDRTIPFVSPLGTAAITVLLYRTLMINDGDCGAIGGMKTGRRNRSTRRNPAPSPLSTINPT
jgi:hypothetical protein